MDSPDDAFPGFRDALFRGTTGVPCQATVQPHARPTEIATMFVVCGEALMDVFAAGDTPTGVALDARVGGSPFNVAVGLARLAQPVAFFSALSTGFLGNRLLCALTDEGVDVSAV